MSKLYIQPYISRTETSITTIKTDLSSSNYRGATALGKVPTGSKRMDVDICATFSRWETVTQHWYVNNLSVPATNSFCNVHYYTADDSYTPLYAHNGGGASPSTHIRLSNISGTLYVSSGDGFVSSGTALDISKCYRIARASDSKSCVITVIYYQ